MSNQKILKVVLALRNLIKVYYKVFTKESANSEDPSGPIIERFAYQLGIRTSLKEQVIAALMAAIQAMLNYQLETIQEANPSTQMTLNEKCKRLF